MSDIIDQSFVSASPRPPRHRRPTNGIRIGIVTLASSHDLMVGNVQHAASFPFPISYAAAHGVELPALMRGEASALAPIRAAAQTLEALGVDIIMGACGSFVHYQTEVAAAVDVPVCLSILMQVPLLLRMLPPKRKLGIIFARSSAFTALAREQAGISDSDTTRIVALEAAQLPSFAPLLQPDLTLDDGELRKDVMALAVEAAQRHPAIGGWLIQCSDLPPYSGDIAQATGLPVWDMSLLIEHFHSASARRTYRQSADHALL